MHMQLGYMLLCMSWTGLELVRLKLGCGLVGLCAMCCSNGHGVYTYDARVSP